MVFLYLSLKIKVTTLMKIQTIMGYIFQLFYFKKRGPRYIIGSNAFAYFQYDELGFN